MFKESMGQSNPAQETIKNIETILDEIAPGFKANEREAILEVAAQHIGLLTANDNAARVFTQEAAKFITQQTSPDTEKEALVLGLTAIAASFEKAA